MGRIAGYRRIGQNVVNHYRAGCDDSACADAHTPHDDTVHADPGIVFEDRRGRDMAVIGLTGQDGSVMCRSVRGVDRTGYVVENLAAMCD